MVSGTWHHSSCRGSVSPSHEWGCGTPCAKLQEILTEILLTSQISPSGIPNDVSAHSLASGLSPSEILNGHQIRLHIAQGRQSQITRAETTSSSSVAKVLHSYKAGTPVYAAYYGPRNDKDPRWVPAIVKKPLGARTILVHICPRGPVWKRHIEQLRPRYGADQDADPGEVTIPESTTHPPLQNPAHSVVPDTTAQPPLQIPGPAEPMSRWPQQTTYDPDNPRRSRRQRRPRVILDV